MTEYMIGLLNFGEELWKLPLCLCVVLMDGLAFYSVSLLILNIWRQKNNISLLWSLHYYRMPVWSAEIYTTPRIQKSVLFLSFVLSKDAAGLQDFSDWNYVFAHLRN